MKKKESENFSEAETQQRFEAALRGARAIGHKSHEEDRPGKPRTKLKKSPRKKKAS